MIIDCFMFLREFDLLEIRLRELDAVADKFVIVESSRSFTGNPKPFYFDTQFLRYANWLRKIIRVKVNDTPVSFDPHQREAFERNAIIRGLPDLKDSDVVMISDVDEIPRAAVVKRYKIEQGVVGLHQSMYRYYINCLTKERWIGTKIVPGSVLKKHPPDFIRWHAEEIGCKFIEDAGWHFTSTGGAEEFKYKLESFAHAGCEWHESEIEEYRNGTIVERLVRDGNLKVVGIDGSYPEFVQKNVGKVLDWGLLHEPKAVAAT